MAKGQDERKLTAILAADVVGYSGLIEANESGTRAALRTHRAEAIDPKISEHRGRIVSTAGDSVLAEFASVVDAVQCAAEIQRAMSNRNEGVSEDKRIAFRIGVNLGDIIVEGDDIHGDGVNVAARLESLADPGGVFISGDAFRQVENKLELGYENLGEQKVKGISKPIQVYRLLLAPEAAGTLITAKVSRQVPWLWLSAAAVVLIIVIGGAAVWNFVIRDGSVTVEVANVADAALQLPDRPSIAVLPFDNLSNDPEQEYFADGMADTLLTDLSRLPDLFVIARNSSFANKGRAVDVRQVGRELGVKFVLEGSVLRVGDQVRINAQLVDTASGGHVWAERFDDTMDNVFALQDRITEKIVTALAIELTGSVEAQEAQSETTDPQAYDAFLKGWDLLQGGGPDGGAAAIPFFERAIAHDPEYGRAYAALALTYRTAIEQGWWQRLGLTYGETNDKTKEYLALALERPTALAHRVSAQVHLGRAGRNLQELAVATVEAKRAIELEPNNADGYLALVQVLVKSGKHEEVLDAVTTAKRLDPQNPQIYDRWGGQALFLLGRFEDAAATLRQVVELDPEDLWSHMWLGVAYAELGREDEGRAEIVRLNAMRTERSGLGPIGLSVVRSFYLHPPDVDRLRAGLFLTGVRVVSAPPTRRGDRLKGEELRAFSGLPWWYGNNAGKGTEYWMFFNPQGEVVPGGSTARLGLRRGGIRSLGIENDRICFAKSGYGKFCSPIYRTPEGTRENNDEYIVLVLAPSISLFVEFPVSAYEERPPALEGK